MPIGNRIPKFVNISTHIIIAHRQLYIAKALLNHNLQCYNFNDISVLAFPSEMSLKSKFLKSFNEMLIFIKRRMVSCRKFIFSYFLLVYFSI